MTEDLEDFLQEENDNKLYEHFSITVDKGQSLLRIDKFLMIRIENATRNKIQQAADNGICKIELQSKAWRFYSDYVRNSSTRE